MDHNKNKYHLDNLKNYFPNTKVNFDILSSQIKELHLILFSAISSIKYFYSNKVPILKSQIHQIQLTILELIKSNNNSQSNKTNNLINILLNNLKTWVGHTNRIDIINSYLKIGNIMDIVNIPILFDIDCTTINERPINDRQFDLLSDYDGFKEQRWNVCSQYGIEYLFQLLERGWKKLLLLRKKGTRELKKQIDTLVR